MPQLIVVVLGMALGLILGAKLISYLLSKHKQLIYAGILGLIVGSLPQVFPTLNQPVSTIAVMVVFGMLIYRLNRTNGG